MHIDDPIKQIELTMEVVEAILKSRDEWCDVTRGIGYFHDDAFIEIYKNCCEAHNIPEFPLAIFTQTLSHDLLFEIEATRQS